MIPWLWSLWWSVVLLKTEAMSVCWLSRLWVPCTDLTHLRCCQTLDIWQSERRMQSELLVGYIQSTGTSVTNPNTRWPKNGIGNSEQFRFFPVSNNIVGEKNKNHSFFIAKSIGPVLSVRIRKNFITTSFPEPTLDSPGPCPEVSKIEKMERQCGVPSVQGCHSGLFQTHPSYCCSEKLRLSERKNSSSTVSSVVSTGTLLFSTVGE